AGTRTKSRPGAPSKSGRKSSAFKGPPWVSAVWPCVETLCFFTDRSRCPDLGPATWQEPFLSSLAISEVQPRLSRLGAACKPSDSAMTRVSLERLIPEVVKLRGRGRLGAHQVSPV